MHFDIEVFVDAFGTLVRDAREKGGGSASITGKHFPDTGYVVGGISDSLIHGLDVLNPDHEEILFSKVYDFVMENVTALSDDSTFLGVWIDQKEGIVYWDVSEVYASKQDAIDVGRLRNELAIWDIVENFEIRVPVNAA